jgi:hypothetical protein
VDDPYAPHIFSKNRALLTTNRRLNVSCRVRRVVSTMNQVRNLSRRRFGLLEVVRRAPRDTRYGNAIWLCRCCCGREVPVRGDHLLQGRRRACGFANCCPSLRKVAHAEHTVWLGMRTRCYGKTYRSYENYGGRGITICDRWRGSFENFLSDMGPRPSLKHSIDRINNDGNYEPGNCRWATKKEQMRNTRNTIFVESGGKRLPLADLIQQAGVTHKMVYYRLRSGWSLDEALLMPPKKPTDSRRRRKKAKPQRWRTPKIKEVVS